MSGLEQNAEQTEPAFNAGDAASVKTRQQKNDFAKRERLDGLRLLMSDKNGRKYMWQLLSDCRMFTTSFSSDIAVMALNEGKRSVGLKATADIMLVDPQLYLTMQKENSND